MRVVNKDTGETASAERSYSPGGEPGWDVFYDEYYGRAGFYLEEEFQKRFEPIPKATLEFPVSKYTLKLDASGKITGLVDNVNSPEHYTNGHVETIYAIENVLGPEGFKAYCMGNYMKYMARHRKKNGEEDLKKAEVYLGWAANGLPAPVNGKVPK